MRLKIRVIPRASRTGWGGRRGEALVVRLTAAPADGRANDLLRRFLAEQFGTPLRSVVIEHGAKSREKVVRVDDPQRLPEEIS